MKNPIIGIVAIVLLLIVGTNDTFAQKTEIQPRGQKMTTEQRRAATLESRTQRQLDLWGKRLSLTEQQVDEIRPVLAEYITAMSDIKKNEALDDAGKKAQSAELGKAYDIKFRSFLTEEQLKVYDNYRGHRKSKAQQSK